MSRRTWLISGLSVASAGLLLFYERRRRLRKAHARAKTVGGRLLPLHPSEVEYGMFAGRPALVTMFRGIIPKELLKQRVAEIVKSNPWLAGRLRTSPSTGQPCLWVPDAPDSSPCLLVMRGSLSTAAPSVLYCSGGESALDTDAMLFKVGLLIDEDAQASLLIISICHAIGDGFTLYSLYHMLDERVQITEMKPEREESFPSIVESINGPDGNRKQRWLDMRRAAGYSPTPLLSAAPRAGLGRRLVLAGMRAYGFLRCKCAKSKPIDEVKVICRFVNADWVQQQKKKMQGAVVSTNDIVTSWFMRTCDGVGTMNINVRGRNSKLSNSHAGNYVMEFCYFPTEMEPNNIRQSLLNLNTQCADNGLPAPPPKSMSVPRAHVTTWAGLYHDVNFPGCKQLLHWPNVAQLLIPSSRSRVIEDWDQAYVVMMLFRPTPNTLGVVILSNNNDLVRQMSSDGCLGQDLVDHAVETLSGLGNATSKEPDR